MVLTDSCLAESMKLQVLITMISASSARGVSSAPLWWSRPIMTSESTRFLGQPRETNPTLGRVCGEVAGGSSTPVFWVVAGGVTDFYFSIFIGFLLGLRRLVIARQAAWFEGFRRLETDARSSCARCSISTGRGWQ